MRLLTIDIETSPSLGYVWSLWQQNVSLSQLVEAGEVLCFAAKWRGDRSVEFRSSHHDGKEPMIRRAWELMDEADAIVHYNGRSFDMKHLRREFALAGMTPPSPHKDIDLLTVVRKQFRFVSNKLDHVAQQLGLGSKMQHSGFEMWRDCLTGDEKAWREMRRYNIQDVKLTEALYERLLPWIHNHPHHGLYDVADTLMDVCQRCGSDELMRRGYAYTPLGRYAQLKCKSCGSWSRGRQRLAVVDARGIA